LRDGLFVAIDTSGAVVGKFATLWEASRVLQSLDQVKDAAADE